MWLWLTLLAVLGYSLAVVLIRKGYDNDLSPAQTKFFDVFFYVLILVPYALIKGGFNFDSVMLISGLGLVIGFNYYFYLKGISKGQINLVKAIYSTSPIFVMILAKIFLAESINSSQIFLILVVVVGSLILGIPKNLKKEVKRFKPESWVFWGFLATVLVAINDVLAKGAVDISTATTVILIFPLADIPMAIGFLLWEKKPVPLKFNRRLMPTILGAAINNLSAIAFFESLALGKVSLITGVLGGTAVLTMILAYFILGEKVTWWQFLGIITISVGVSALGFVSV